MKYKIIAGHLHHDLKRRLIISCLRSELVCKWKSMFSNEIKKNKNGMDNIKFCWLNKSKQSKQKKKNQCKVID